MTPITPILCSFNISSSHHPHPSHPHPSIRHIKPLDGSRGVSGAYGVQRTIGEQVVVSTHEVRVASNARLGIQPGNSLSDEFRSGGLIDNTRDISVQGKLSDPNLLQAVVGGSGDGVRDESLEVVNRVTVPVNSQAGNVARGAVGHELLEPAQTLTVSGRRGHSGRDQLGGSGERGDVLHVVTSSHGGGHVSLGGHIRLVEAHDVVTSAGQDGLDSREPATEEAGAPKHGDVFDARGETGVSGENPVVGPADSAGLGESGDGGNVVVSSSTLGGGALVHLVQIPVHVHVVGHSEGSGSQQACSEKVGEGNHFEC